MTETTDSPAPRGNARFKVALILLMPFLVVSLATIVFYTGIGIPRATSNKGVLLIPPRQIDELGLRDAKAESWGWESGSGGWGIVYVGAASCTADCQERLTLARQVHKSIGREQDRVRRYYLATADSLDPATAAYLDKEHPGLRVLHASEAGVRGLLGREGDPEPLASQALYLVDPRGFVMMYYLPTHPGRAALDDLRFLLKNSPR
jgi:hypothetical protein